MKPMSLSVAVITDEHSYSFSCGGLTIYTTNYYATSHAEEGTIEKFGTKTVEWAITTLARGGEVRDYQKILLSSDANKSLLEKVNIPKNPLLASPTIPQKIVKKLINTKANKSMAVAYYERKRSE